MSVPDGLPVLLEQLTQVNATTSELNTRLDQLREDMTEETTRLEKEAAARETRQRRRTVFFSAIMVVLLVIVGLLSWGVVNQFHINSRQNCLNDANDTRSRSALAFYEREVTKLYGQVAGFTELRSAATATGLSPAQRNAATLKGFDKFLTATRTAADSNAQVLHKLGVQVVLGPNGAVSYRALSSAPGTVKC